ncbi:virulence factor [Streptomyces sp. NPDC002176]|uniref:virulence factor n=1 Tax=Streptomyces sp. NPDC002176 TaxID=3364634 RepID=UPI00384B3DD2
MRTNAPPFPRLPRRALGRLLASTTLVTVAALTITGSQLQPLARTLPVSATEDTPGYDLDAAAKTRAAQCLLNLMQRKGGQEMKSVARRGLNGSDAELLQAANPAYYEDPPPPLDVAYNNDKASASAKMDELYDRHHEWEKSLNVEPPAGYTYTGFQWIEQKDNPFSTTGLSGWIADQFWQSEYDLFHEDQAPVANADSVAAVTKIATTRYSEDRQEDYEDWSAWKWEMQFMHPMYADDARIFLQNGGFPTTAPDPASMEYRVDVEGLKARFASCTTHNPPDPHHVLTSELITASAEWQQEIDGQRTQRDTILGEEAQASADLQIATQALGEALGQSMIASRLADWQAYWLKQTPASAGLSYPEAAVFTKVKADIVKAQAMALGRVFVASRASQSAQRHAATAIAAQQAAYGIADAAGLPRGRGLLYGQQAVQVTRASASAAVAVAKATETASNATRASAADSKTLLALAQTQAHASAADFRRVAAEEAAAQAKAAADGAAVQATKAAENATKAKAAQAKAEAAEVTAKNAAADAHAKRLTAEAERDKARTQKDIAATERQKAAEADQRAQSERTTAAAKLAAAQTAGNTAATKKDAALTAERNAVTARNDALSAEALRDALGAKASAKEAKAYADEGTDAAAASRTAATQARAAANAATTAATNARAAATEATNAAANAREAATKAEAAASRAKAASDAAQRDVAVTNAAVTKAHAAAADAIGFSEAAAGNVRAAKALADTAQAKAVEAKANAALARIEANAAAASAVKTAGFAYATAQAALAARDSARQVINPANDAIELGSPYKETDASAGLAVLVGQAAKTAAEQQEALAKAKAAQAAKAATEAAALAAAASADAKAAATAASAAAASAAAATVSLGKARASAAEASAAAQAAIASEARTVEYDRQATADAAVAAAASTEAAGYATQARTSADAAEQDAASARGAATAAEADAATARGVADQAERDATAAEASAARAQEAAKEAQEAADRAEKAAQAKQIDTGTVPDGDGGSIGNMFYVVDHVEKIGEPGIEKKTGGCDGWIDKLFYTGDCTITAKIRYKAIVDLYLCTTQQLNPSQYTCPSSETLYLGQHATEELSTTVTHTITIAEYQSNIDPIDILFGSWIKCAQKFAPGGESGSWGGCAWAAVDVASLFAGKALRPIADAVRAADAAARTGIGYLDAYRALRSLGLSEEAVAGISKVQFQRLAAACPPALARSTARALAAASARCPDYVAVAPSGLGIVAGIDAEGLVSMAVKVGGDTPSGGVMFNNALAHFGDKVKGVKAYWQNGGELSDNLNNFNKALREGKSLDEAAKSFTFTGYMSGKAGFTSVEFIELRGMYGQYTEVGVIFR